MPKQFSIAMCTYNGARHLREQLESIARQTRIPDELVICDDRSTDDTRSIVTDFAASSPFPVRLAINETQLGFVRNFEKAISLCSGDYIALCDQDDIWLPEKLPRFEAEFERSPAVGLVFSNAELIDEEGKSLGETLWDKLPIRQVDVDKLRSRNAIDLLLQGSTVTGATSAFRSGLRNLILPIPVDLPIIHDAWIAILVAATGEIVPLANPLIKYRQHGDQQVGAKEKKVSEAGVAKALGRVTSYDEMIQVCGKVRQRLVEHVNVYKTGDAVARLDAQLVHLTVRAKLPESFLSRLRTVIAELSSGRYHAYSRGFFSAAKDLLRSAGREDMGRRS